MPSNSIHIRTQLVVVHLLSLFIIIFCCATAPQLHAQSGQATSGQATTKQAQTIREPQAEEILHSLDSLLLQSTDSSALRIAIQNSMTEFRSRLEQWNAFKDSLRVEILSPPDSITTVPKRSVLVKGRVTKPQAEVWLLARWEKSPYYWVQRPAVVAPDGTWQANIYAGSTANNSGHVFEIRAFAGLQAPLEISQILFTWPEALAQSNVVKVKRK